MSSEVKVPCHSACIVSVLEDSMVFLARRFHHRTDSVNTVQQTETINKLTVQKYRIT